MSAFTNEDDLIQERRSLFFKILPKMAIFSNWQRQICWLFMFSTNFFEKRDNKFCKKVDSEMCEEIFLLWF